MNMTDGKGRMPLFYHPDYEIPTQGPGHPESPDRVREIMRTISNEELPVDILPPRDFLEKDLYAAHVESHIKRVRDFGIGYMDPDTFHTDKVFDQSLKAAGGVLGAAEKAYLEKRPAFAIPRPPGHHAGFDYNMGFCYFNNVALAARIMQKEQEEIEKIAIIDLDAHHGNGTSDIFVEDPDVLYISTHNWGIFPGTGHLSDVGAGKGEGRTVNIPFQWGAGDHSFIAATEEIILPILRSFGPDLILISLGVDSHLMDPLTGLALSTPGHLKILEMIHDLARKEASSRICVELEGGYHIFALAEVMAGSIDLMLPEEQGVSIRYKDSKESSPDRSLIEKVREVQSNYWKV